MPCPALASRRTGLFFLLNMSSLIASALLLAAAPQSQPPAPRAPQAQPRSAVGGVLISPLLHRAMVRPGSPDKVVFKVENPGLTPHTASISLRPFVPESWTYRTLFDKPHGQDASLWFEQRTLQVRLEPGQKREVVLPLRVPREAAGPHWCMMQFTPRPEGSLTKSLVVYEIPIVLVAGKNPRARLEVSSPVIQPAVEGQKRGALYVKIPVANDSDGFTILGGTGALVDAGSGRTVQDLIVEDRNLMPRSQRHLAFLVPTLPDGRYRVSFRVASGARSLQPVAATFAVRQGAVEREGAPVAVRQSRLVMEPASVNVSVPRGGTRTVTVRVTNPTSQPTPVSIQVFGLEQGPTGAIGIGGTALPQGLAAQLEGSTTPLAPGESRTLRLKMTVPRTASGDLWFALAATEAGPRASLAETITFTVTVPSTERAEVALTQAQVIKDGPRSVAVKFRVENKGNVALRPLPSAAVLEEGVRLADRLEVPLVGDGGLLPGAAVRASVMLPPKLKPGSHIVEISYQYGPSDFARLRVPIQVGAPAPRKQK